MEALRNALALLVTLEARITEVVDPAKAQADMLKTVVKECAIALDGLHKRITAIEEQVKAMGTPSEAPPAEPGTLLVRITPGTQREGVDVPNAPAVDSTQDSLEA